jgi:hypothetical protein
MATKKRSHGGARPGAGRPARSRSGPSTKRTFLFSDEESALLARLAAKLKASESDVLRLGLIELGARHGLG